MTSPVPSSSPPANARAEFLKVLLGASISGGMAYLLIRLLQSIVAHLPPIALDGPVFARNISVAVRYLLVGSIGLMAFMFVMVAVGLTAYIGQLVWQGFVGKAVSAPLENSLEREPPSRDAEPETVDGTQSQPQKQD
ncbi:DUF3082 domain-containing protein [Synechococcus sp. PCC 7336]|uniref:DUF3082 domain-containing protein n=1 Tax=Synechococcus sp. PCC 7336 TaxID=195250 RepID=UPI00034741E9|nr:DUF3082 domain-containing protein [Synechococcus sp. PCC 7336]